MSNVIPIRRDQLADAQTLIQSAIGRQFVALIGNPSSGFAVVGPFADVATAETYLDAHDREGWVLDLSAPRS